MSFERLWGFLAFALPALAGLLAPMSMVDLAYQLRAGEEILATRGIPAVDTWTFTVAGTPWFDQQWGAQVVLSAVFGVGGWAGLALLRAACIALAFLLAAAACTERGAGPRASALLSLGAFLVAAPSLGLRPQLFAVVLFAATLWLLAGRRRAPLRNSAVPILAVLWANAHGSFVIAPALAGWAWLEDVAEHDPAARRSFVVLLVTAAATVVTPYGPAVWAYALALSANATIASRVSEWQPPSLTQADGLVFLVSVVVVAGAVALAWRRGRVPPWPSLVLVFGLAVLGLRAVRAVAWWPLGAAVALAPLVAPARSPAARTRPTPATARRLNAVVVAVLGVAIVGLAASWTTVDPRTDTSGRFIDAPAGVTAAVAAAASPGARLFHPQRWGSWLEYAVPGVRTFVDSRIELFPDAVWDEYDAVATMAAGWQSALHDREVDLVVVEPRDEALAETLRLSGWAVLYRGDDGLVLRRPVETAER